MLTMMTVMTGCQLSYLVFTVPEYFDDAPKEDNVDDDDSDDRDGKEPDAVPDIHPTVHVLKGLESNVCQATYTVVFIYKNSGSGGKKLSASMSSDKNVFLILQRILPRFVLTF